MEGPLLGGGPGSISSSRLLSVPINSGQILRELSQQRMQALLVGFGEILEQLGLALQRHLHQPI